MDGITDKQWQFLRGIKRAHYPTISAMEAGDPELAVMLDGPYVSTYWGIGGTHLRLTDAGNHIVDKNT